MSCKRILFFLFPLFGSIIYDDDGSWSSSGFDGMVWEFVQPDFGF